jgi:hypothetical protein
MIWAHSRLLAEQIESDPFVAKVGDVQVDVILRTLNRTT